MLTVRRSSSVPSLGEMESTYCNQEVSKNNTSSFWTSGMKQKNSDDGNFGNTPMSAILIFKPQETSDFTERRVQMISGKNVIIGRGSSTNGPPTSTNMFFDSKVMSKTHACIWYDHTIARFYIKDKSSNGTFLNMQHDGKLLKTGNPYVPKLSRNKREINHGDILQLGVDITEGHGRERVSHNCVRGVVHLYFPDGTEGIKSTWGDSSHTVPPDYSSDKHPEKNLNSKSLVRPEALYNPIPTPNTNDMHIMKMTLQEAIYRQRRMMQKMKRLTEIVQSNGSLVKKLWKPVVDEVLMFDYVEALCREREIIEKKFPPESVERVVSQLIREKLSCQHLARQAVKDVMNEHAEKLNEINKTQSYVQELKEKFALCQALCVEKSDLVEGLLEENEYLKKRLKATAVSADKNTKMTLHASTNEKTDFNVPLPVEPAVESPIPTTVSDIQNDCVDSQFYIAMSDTNSKGVLDRNWPYNDNGVLHENEDNDSSKNGGNGDTHYNIKSIPDMTVETIQRDDDSLKENTVHHEIKPYLSEIQNLCEEAIFACVFEDVCEHVVGLLAKIKLNVDNIDNACCSKTTIIEDSDQLASEKKTVTGIEENTSASSTNVAEKAEEGQRVESLISTESNSGPPPNVDSDDMKDTSDYDHDLDASGFSNATALSPDAELKQLIKHFQKGRNHSGQEFPVLQSERDFSTTQKCVTSMMAIFFVLIAAWVTTLNHASHPYN